MVWSMSSRRRQRPPAPPQLLTLAACWLLCWSLAGAGSARRYRGASSLGNASHEVRVQLTQLKLQDFSYRGSLHVDRIELRSEEQDRNAFYVHNPTDPNYPLWAAARPSVAEAWPLPLRDARRDAKALPRRPRVLRVGQRLRLRLLGGCDRSDVARFAARRFSELAFVGVTAVSDSEGDEPEAAVAVVEDLEISVRNASFPRFPHLDMREDYELDVDPSGIRLSAQEHWGIVRGLETLAQLIFISRRQPNQFLINVNRIKDRPAFKYRGLMIDTGRHFIQKATLLENLEAMAMNKMNVFHWHMVDDQSFPYLSRKFPQLALKSAYAGGRYFYTADDIRQVVEFARLRGIRVVPELDTPDHTHSWGHAMPDIVSWCTVSQLAYTGPLDPTNSATFRVLAELYAEVADLFPDDWLHLGMDEVSVDCWRLNATVHKFMRDNGIASHEQLVVYYANRLSGIIENLAIKKKSMVWEDILSRDGPGYPLKLPKDAAVQVWITRDQSKLADWRQRYRLVRSEDWYLDHSGYGADWVKRYRFQPDPNDLGGEACMWTEFQADSTVTQRIWPSVSAVAERLWSGDAAADPVKAAPRIEEQNCRMMARGIRVGVAGGPGMCQTPATLPRPPWLISGEATDGQVSSEILVNLSSGCHDNYWLYKWGSIAVALGFLLLKAAPAARRRLPARVPAMPRLGPSANYERILCCLLLLYCMSWFAVQL